MTSFNTTSPLKEVTSPSSPALIVSCCFYVLPLVVGIAGNACIVQIILSHKSLHTGVNAYIANMAALDLAVCTMLVPLRMVYYLVPVQSGLLTLCKAGVFFHSLLDAGRLLFLGAISFERYQAVANPFRRDKVAAARRAAITLGVLWGVMLVYAAVTTEFFYDTIMFELCAKQEAVAGDSDGDGSGSGSSSSANGIDWSLWGGIEIYFVLPLSLLTVALVIVCYVLMFRVLSTQSKKMQSHGGRGGGGGNSKAQANKSKGFLKKKVSPAAPVSPTPVKTHLHPPPPAGAGSELALTSPAVSTALTVVGSDLDPARVTLVKESTSKQDNVCDERPKQLSPAKVVDGVQNRETKLVKESFSKSDNIPNAHAKQCIPVEDIPEIALNTSDALGKVDTSQDLPGSVSLCKVDSLNNVDTNLGTSVVFFNQTDNTGNIDIKQDSPTEVPLTKADDFSEVNTQQYDNPISVSKSAHHEQSYRCSSKRVSFSSTSTPVTVHSCPGEMDNSAISGEDCQQRTATGDTDSDIDADCLAHVAPQPHATVPPDPTLCNTTNPAEFGIVTNSPETRSDMSSSVPHSDGTNAYAGHDRAARHDQAQPESSAADHTTTRHSEARSRSVLSDRCVSPLQHGKTVPKSVFSSGRRSSRSKSTMSACVRSVSLPLSAKPGKASRVVSPNDDVVSRVGSLPNVSCAYPPLISVPGLERGKCAHSAMPRLEVTDVNRSQGQNLLEFGERKQLDPVMSDTSPPNADIDHLNEVKVDHNTPSHAGGNVVTEVQTRDTPHLDKEFALSSENVDNSENNSYSNSEQRTVIIVKEANTEAVQANECFSTGKDKADKDPSNDEPHNKEAGGSKTVNNNNPTQIPKSETAADENGSPLENGAPEKKTAESTGNPENSKSQKAEGGSDTVTAEGVKIVKVVDMDGTAHVEQVSTSNNIQGSVCMFNPKNRMQGKRRVELKVAKRLVVIFLSFLLLWIPYPFAVLAVRLLHMKDDSGQKAASPWQPGVQQMVKDVICVLSALTTVTAAVNPVFYGLANVNIRSVIVARLKRVCKCCKRK